MQDPPSYPNCRVCGNRIETPEELVVRVDTVAAPTFGDNHARLDGMKTAFHAQCYRTRWPRGT